VVCVCACNSLEPLYLEPNMLGDVGGLVGGGIVVVCFLLLRETSPLPYKQIELWFFACLFLMLVRRLFVVIVIDSA
jgi:hypothetical protein